MKDEYFENFKLFLVAAIKSAAREYLKAVLQRIPVRTGFLAGSFANLATLTGLGARAPTTTDIQKLFNISGKQTEQLSGKEIEAQAKIRKHELIKELIGELKAGARIITTKKGKKKFKLSQKERNRIREHIIKLQHEEYYYPSKGKAGRVLKTPRTGVQFTTPLGEMIQITDNKISFEFNNAIIYYRINDFYSGHSPTAPWGSLEAGQQAFDLELKRQLNKLPNVTDFLVVTEIFLEKNGSVRKRTSKYLPD